MTPQELQNELKHQINHSRNLQHLPVTEKQLLHNLLANQVLIMETLAKLLPCEPTKI